MVRFGVVGCGVIHGTHCDALQRIDGAKLTAVHDILPERTRAASEKYGVVGVDSLEELFDHVDVVNVCVPSGLHSEIAVRAAQAGKHVLSEKPIEINLANAQAMVAAAKKAGVKLGTISQHRFAKDMQRLQQAAQGGELGRLLVGDMTVKWYRTQAYYDSGDWRGTWALDGGGCLMNQGVHYVDMIQWIMGGVKSVQAITKTTSHDIEVEDHAMALVEYKNGAIGVLEGSTCCFPGFSERVEVHGTCGSVVLEGDKIKHWEIDPNAANDPSPYGRGVTAQPTPKDDLYGENSTEGSGAADPTAIWMEQHRLQIEDFARAVADDREPFITGEMALEPLKVILAIYESSRRGGERVEV